MFVVAVIEASSTQTLRIPRGTPEFAAGSLDRNNVGPSFGSDSVSAHVQAAVSQAKCALCLHFNIVSAALNARH